MTPISPAPELSSPAKTGRSSNHEIFDLGTASVLSRDSRAAQRIEVPDQVRDSCFGCPSVGQPAESCLARLARIAAMNFVRISSNSA